MGCAVVVLQEGLKKWAFDLGGFPIVNLDLFHGVHTPVITAFYNHKEQSALACRTTGKKAVLHPFPASLVPLPKWEAKKIQCFKWKQTWLSQSTTRILCSALEHLPSFIHFLYFSKVWQGTVVTRFPWELNLKHYCNGKTSCGWNQSQRCLFEQRFLN